MVIIWALIPLLLITILGVSLADWEQPDYADKIKWVLARSKHLIPDCIPRYPDWIHGIGYFLILVAVAQIPIWALFMTLYYLCAPSKRVRIFQTYKFPPIFTRSTALSSISSFYCSLITPVSVSICTRLLLPTTICPLVNSLQCLLISLLICSYNLKQLSPVLTLFYPPPGIWCCAPHTRVGSWG